MNALTPSVPRRDYRISFRIEAACEFFAVRTAILVVRDWLAENNLTEAELSAWELALVEASNNAVKYAPPAAHKLPVTIELSLGKNDIEGRVTDHTKGFDWPETIDLPDVESESGRGLFLIHALMNNVRYFRNKSENILVLRRVRPTSSQKVFLDAGQLQQLLAEAETALTDMTAELSSTYESLVALFRYSAQLGTSPDVKDFSRRLLRDLMQLAEADCAVLRLLTHDGKQLETLLSFPETAEITTLDLATPGGSAEISAARRRQDIWFDAENPLSSGDPLRAVIPVGNGLCHAFFVADQLVGTATLGRMAAGKPFTAAQVNLLHSFIDFLAIQIVNVRLLDDRTASRVTRRELEIAASIQRSLLPAELPVCRPFDLAATCQSAQKVGGDFYDVIPAGNGAALVVIADVMGKGVPAALFAAVLRSTIRSMPHLFAEPGRVLDVANHTLFEDLSRVDMFATAKLVYIDPQRGEMIAASAGHCPLLLWQPGDPSAQALSSAGFPLGIEPHVIYSQTTTALPPGALALLYTDGLSELRNPAGVMLGEENLQQMLARAGNQTLNAEAAKNKLLEQLTAYRGEAPLSDDQTLVLIRHLP